MTTLLKKFKLLIFDFDGTLVDTRQDIANAVNLALKELDLRMLKPEAIFPFIGRGVSHLMECSLENTGYKDQKNAVAVFKKHYRKNLIVHSRLYPECQQTLDNLKSKKMAILSNKPHEFIIEILRALETPQWFSCIVGGDTKSTKKPDPEGLLHILKQEGVSADEALMIGDSPIDVETGKKAQVMTCAVNWGFSEPEEIASAKPDWTINHFCELATLKQKNR